MTGDKVTIPVTLSPLAHVSPPFFSANPTRRFRAHLFSPSIPTPVVRHYSHRQTVLARLRKSLGCDRGWNNLSKSCSTLSQ